MNDAPGGDGVQASEHADALVFFGATGDLAFKKIFPALQAMVTHDRLDVPVMGPMSSTFLRLRPASPLILVGSGIGKMRGTPMLAGRAPTSRAPPRGDWQVDPGVGR